MLPVSTTVQLAALRVLMANLTLVGDTPLGGYIVPLNDAHQGTRVPECAARMQFISGFSGSSGVVLVTNTTALLWTDGRYFTQAMAELDENWTLMREGLPETLTMEQYLGSFLGPGAVVGVDPSLFSKTAWLTLQSKLQINGQRLTPVEKNLVDSVWDEPGSPQPRPPCPSQGLVLLSEEFTGRSIPDKLQELRNIMASKNTGLLVLNQLDDVAWLLNVRGFDIPSAALFLGYAIVKMDGFEFFVENTKLDDAIRAHLIVAGGSLHEYGDVNQRLTELVSSTTDKIWLDKTCSYSIASIVPENRQYLDLSPVIPMKAVKNLVQIEGVKKALIRDAAILARAYAWIENEVVSGRTLDELSASDKIMTLRRVEDTFLTTSFTTIAGSDSNGAIIHYRPTPATNKNVTRNSMFLIDAGAAYKDGTTDITRTFHYGTPSDYQREAYTRVLKGQIAVARAVFPLYTRGNRLDSFARKYLWQIGLDYGHGTGHGIGINVHEGPSRITYDYALAPDDMGLRENMLTSNEPGYYEEGLFGIRLENIVRVVNSTVLDRNGRPFLAIEDMTYLPYQHKLIKKELLTMNEIEYLNQYQEKCRTIVGEFIRENYPDDSDLAYNWIVKETPPF